ncbi:MAG: diacylglycerol/lipid kinase family protein [Ferrovibrio sp.]|uniref:diacylglycerol/lipid kinase family protein n=1 Tax=Ferrovibrio sp. TaxID=1917215 RepID=UPI00391CB93B
MLSVVINAASGTARQHGAEALHDLIADSAAGAGLGAVDVQVVPPKLLPQALVQAAENSDEIWVGGGDGTLRSAAELMQRRDGVLGVLPLGTMNLLARDLNIPLEVDAAVCALAQADIVAIDVGRVNRGIFLNKSALGLYPEMIVDRERRRLFGLAKWPAMMKSAWRALRRHRLMEITLDYGGQTREIVSPAIVVAVGEYEFRTARLFGRPDLQSGELTVYVSHEKRWFGSAGQLARLFLGTLDGDPALEMIKAHSLRIGFDRVKPVASDGEVEMLPGPISYSVAPRALKVRMPGEVAD